MVGIAVLFVVIVGPLLLGLTGWIRARRERRMHFPTPPRGGAGG